LKNNLSALINTNTFLEKQETNKIIELNNSGKNNDNNNNTNINLDTNNNKNFVNIKNSFDISIGNTNNNTDKNNLVNNININNNISMELISIKDQEEKRKKSLSTKNLNNPLISKIELQLEEKEKEKQSATENENKKEKEQSTEIKTLKTNINTNKNTNTINIQKNEISNFDLLSKIFNSINTQINETLNGSQDSIIQSIKDLVSQKTKFFNLNQKAEKIIKDIDQAFQQKNKLNSGDLNSYNLTLKEKAEDKILNLINDFEETKLSLRNNYEEIKKLENNFNEIIKGNFFHNLLITIKGIKNLRICFEEAIDNKIKYLNFDKELIAKNIKEINELGFITENVNSNYNQGSLNSNSNSVLNSLQGKEINLGN
jgi:hypothetical protein